MNSRLMKQAQAESYARVSFVFSVNTPAGWTLQAELDRLGVTRKAIINITINPGVIVGRMNLNSAPAKSKVRIVNYGTIVGAPNSGPGMVIAVATRIDNKGTIAGGGGRGGDGGRGQAGYLDMTSRACMTSPIAAGGGGNGAGLVGTTIMGAVAGGAGTQMPDSGAYSGSGGIGGALGQPGGTGGSGNKGNSWPGGTLPGSDGNDVYYPTCGPFNGGIYETGYAGAVPGNPIIGSSFVTWVTRGTITGPLA